MAHPLAHPARHKLLLALLLSGLGVLALDALGLDLPLARWLGNGRGFPLRDHWVLSTVLHSGARAVGWLVLLALTLCTVRPVGIFAAMSRRERVWMVASIWLSIVLIAVVKGISTSACPWDLVEFGGTTPYLSHWSWLTGPAASASGGHCFPAGHASTAFAFLAVPLWLHRVQPTWAWRSLWGILATGLVLGVAQQVRGAHFLSHTLWSAWLCAAVALAVFLGAGQRQGREI